MIRIKCPGCAGQGSHRAGGDVHDEYPCDECHGSGEIDVEAMTVQQLIDKLTALGKPDARVLVKDDIGDYVPLRIAAVYDWLLNVAGDEKQESVLLD